MLLSGERKQTRARVSLDGGARRQPCELDSNALQARLLQQTFAPLAERAYEAGAMESTTRQIEAQALERLAVNREIEALREAA
jgi:hypothetical protein